LRVNDVPFIKFHSVSTKPGRCKKPVLALRALSSGSPSYGFVVERLVSKFANLQPLA